MKIGRAETHLKAFDNLVVEYCTSNPYEAQSRDDVANDRYVVTLTPRLIKGEVALTLADFVYALRSGLDQLAWNLSLLGTPSPSRDTMFPIHSDRSSRSEDSFRKKVWDMPCEAIAIIKELQPYQSGDDYVKHPLWQLNELSNIDKHRVPSGRANVASFNVYPTGFDKVQTDHGTEFSWPLQVKPTVQIGAKPAELTFGDPWDSEPSHRMPLELDRFQIAEIYRYVREDVAPRFERFFQKT
jgi:hypothetical protein